MLFVEFFAWWYSRGLIELFNRSMRLIRSVWTKFSVSVLFKTLFEPWRRIATESGGSIRDRAEAVVDNMVSRMVGFTIRIFSIITALVIEILVIVAVVLALVVWPFVPVLVPLAIIVGIAS